MDRPPQCALAVNPALDIRALAARFAERGRLQIADFLTRESAGLLRAELGGNDQWRRIINGGAKVFEIGSAAFDALPADERQRIDAAVVAGAASGFQFRYDVIRVPDDPEKRGEDGSMLTAFAALMSSPAVLDGINAITGTTPLAFADAQATRYRPGDFLNRHDDDVAGKDRKLAYVLGLTEGWQPEWGGLLLFNRPDGGIVETMTPRFNGLSLFAVPQPHSVSYVAPYAQKSRLSITGWIRGRQPRA